LHFINIASDVLACWQQPVGSASRQK